MNTDPKPPVVAWIDAFNQGDPDAVARCFTPDRVFTDVGTGQRAEGRLAMRQHIVGFLAMFTDLQVELSNFLSAEGHFANEWTMTGIHTGDAPGLAATGRSFRINGAGIGEVREGEVQTATMYWNMADLLTKIGMSPPAPPELSWALRRSRLMTLRPGFPPRAGPSGECMSQLITGGVDHEAWVRVARSETTVERQSPTGTPLLQELGGGWSDCVVMRRV